MEQKAFTLHWQLIAPPFPGQLQPGVALPFSKSGGSQHQQQLPFLSSQGLLERDYFTDKLWLRGPSDREEEAQQVRRNKEAASLVLTECWPPRNPPHPPRLRSAWGSAPRETYDRREPALCPDSHCLQSLTGSCELLGRVRDCGRQHTGRDMFACRLSGEPLVLPGNQGTRAVGPLLASQAASTNQHMSLQPHSPWSLPFPKLGPVVVARFMGSCPM